MIRVFGYVRNIIYYLAIILLVLVCVITAASVFEVPGGYRFFMIESGSMEPFIKTGYVILIRREESYKVGDVVAFNATVNNPLDVSKNVITHRIYEFRDDIKKGKIIFTKGDANQSPDSEPIVGDQILGKMVFKAPYFGYPIRFAKSQIGFILLVIVPGTLIIYSEIINIKNEILGLVKKRRSLKEKKDNISNNIPLVLLLISFSFFTYMFSSKAYFSDNETSKDNIITIDVWDNTQDLRQGILNESLMVVEEENIIPTETPLPEIEGDQDLNIEESPLPTDVPEEI